MALRMRGIVPAEGEVRRALSRVGLDARRAVPARRLSAGQRRRIGLARLQLDPAPLWILDEPLAALDAEGEAMLGECLVRHQDAGGIALVATHHALPISGRAVRELGLRP